MSTADKIENQAQDMAGKAKEYVGEKTGDERLRADGMADQDESQLKQAGEHVKDAARDVRDAVTGR
jgi:uncharacterized protein YjbJ (UPF0337 family)